MEAVNGMFYDVMVQWIAVTECARCPLNIIQPMEIFFRTKIIELDGAVGAVGAAMEAAS